MVKYKTPKQKSCEECTKHKMSCSVPLEGWKFPDQCHCCIYRCKPCVWKDESVVPKRTKERILRHYERRNIMRKSCEESNNADTPQEKKRKRKDENQEKDEVLNPPQEKKRKSENQDNDDDELSTTSKRNQETNNWNPNPNPNPNVIKKNCEKNNSRDLERIRTLFILNLSPQFNIIIRSFAEKISHCNSLDIDVDSLVVNLITISSQEMINLLDLEK